MAIAADARRPTIEGSERGSMRPEERRSKVARLLAPRSIAIVGVSDEPGSIGGAVLANLDRFGYAGDVHLVSRSRRALGARNCLASIDELPARVDVAVLALPAAGIHDAVAACARRSVEAAVIFAAGFAETGEAGQQRQAAVARTAEEAGMALVGPNCIGLVNFADRVPLTYEPVAPQASDAVPAVAVLTQSGAMASALRLALQAKGLAVSHVVSTGNEAVLTAEDFLAALVEDPHPRAVVMFAEQIRDPQRFLAIAEHARSRARPIILMHPGRSARERESARTHTGALAGDHAVMTALVTAAAVVLVETIEELVDTAELLARFPPPAAGAAIVTNSGAFKGFALDFCEAIGLDLAQPQPETLAALAKALPPYAAIDNPLDTTGQTIKEPRIFTDAAAHLLADANVGSLIVSVVPGSAQQAMAKVEALLPPLAATTKATAVAVMSDEGPLPDAFVSSFRNKGVPVFRSPERALRAMAQAARYGRLLAAPRSEEATLLVVPAIDWPPQGVLPEHQGKALLARLGIPVPAGGLARSEAEAEAIAARIGYPVVLKAQSPALAHKTEAGGVAVGIADRPALAAAWQRIHRNVAAARPGVSLDGVLVEAMAAPGLELVIGGRRDPQWGPVVMAGVGGIWVEALGDVRLMPATLPPAAIAAELSKLKAAALFKGLRGSPAIDIDALCATIARVGALLRAAPDIAEIDINPLVASPSGVLALDVLLVRG